MRRPLGCSIADIMADSLCSDLGLVMASSWMPGELVSRSGSKIHPGGEPAQGKPLERCGFPSSGLRLAFGHQLAGVVGLNWQLFAGQSICSIAIIRLIQDTNVMLTGPDLLAKVKEMGDSSKSDLVRSCGYVSSKKDGSERLNFTAFYEALLEAKGVSLGVGGGAGAGKSGRKLSYVTKVQFNGNLLIGKAYTALIDLKPGDEFQIKLGRKQIRLVPVGGDDEDE